jgi:hypothetical protein
MKYIEYIDTQGRKRKSLVRDQDTDPSIGIPAEPPNLDRIDWEAVKLEIHNQLMDQGLYTWTDVQKAQTAVGGIVLSVVRSKIINLYKEDSTHGN